jgi:hypothetical protein
MFLHSTPAIKEHDMRGYFMKLMTAFAVLMSTSSAWAQEIPNMKMATEIPKGITTPDNIQTRMGELSFFDGVPDAETTLKVYNLLDFSHAYQAYLDGTKIASMGAIRKVLLEVGPPNTTAVLFEDLMDSKADLRQWEIRQTTWGA